MTTETLEVIACSFMSILVDNGRQHLQHTGLCESGAMDDVAYRLGNGLVGNPANTPAIEVLGRFECRFSCDVSIAVCGPSSQLWIDGEQVQTWCTVSVRRGQRVALESMQAGQRAYLCICSRDWQVPVLGESVCAVQREKLGGHRADGAMLAHNDVLTARFTQAGTCYHIAENEIPDYSDNGFDIIEGYQAEYFSRVAMARFYSSAYQITADSNRMGYRLKGPAIKSEMTAMRSEGINLGSVQVPADGQPIIMMRDRQTLGGYPKIGAVASYDLYRLAQTLPGSEVTFRSVDANNARGKWLLQEQRLAKLIKE